MSWTERDPRRGCPVGFHAEKPWCPFTGREKPSGAVRGGQVMAVGSGRGTLWGWFHAGLSFPCASDGTPVKGALPAGPCTSAKVFKKYSGLALGL